MGDAGTRRTLSSNEGVGLIGGREGNKFETNWQKNGQATRFGGAWASSVAWDQIRNVGIADVGIIVSSETGAHKYRCRRYQSRSGERETTLCELGRIP